MKRQGCEESVGGDRGGHPLFPPLWFVVEGVGQRKHDGGEFRLVEVALIAVIEYSAR